jgi:ribosomal protein S18 acetylase RimI-like enzyme
LPAEAGVRRQRVIGVEEVLLEDMTRADKHVRIAAMEIEDIPDVLALWQSTPELNVSRSFDTHERVAAYLTRNPGFSSVARDAGHLVGAVLCGHDGRRGSFYHMAVVPAYRRRGIAKRMVERSLSRLRAIGLSTAFVFTHVEQTDAQAFWRGVGWEHCAWVQYRYREF